MRPQLLLATTLALSVGRAWGLLVLPTKLATRSSGPRVVGQRATVAKGQRSSDDTEHDDRLAAKERGQFDPTRRFTLGSLGGLAASLAVPSRAHAAAAADDSAVAGSSSSSSSEGGSVVYSGVINKSPSDPRAYRSLTLQNGLEVRQRFRLGRHVFFVIITPKCTTKHSLAFQCRL